MTFAGFNMSQNIPSDNDELINSTREGMIKDAVDFMTGTEMSSGPSAVELSSDLMTRIISRS